MVSMLDKSVGDVILALRKKGMLENSIIMFISDNGAQSFGIHANYGSNYPLKGVRCIYLLFLIEQICCCI